MSGMRHPKRDRLFVGLLCVALGSYPLSIALGIVHVRETHVHAPMWVIGLSGMVFLIAGCMILFGNHSRLNDMFASCVCLLFGIVGLWVSLFGPTEGFAGGIPLPSQAVNVKIARVVFACGALLCFVLSAYACRRAYRFVGEPCMERTRDP